MPSFLCVVHKLLSAILATVIGYSAVAQLVSVIISFVSVLVRTVNALIPLAVMSF